VSLNDPLYSVLYKSDAPSSVGFLFIRLDTRQRYRINGHIVARSADHVDIQIVESYPNCPKYIQQRKFHQLLDTQNPKFNESHSFVATKLTTSQKQTLESADTFFLSSYHHNGADCSHRGGFPGFIKVIDDQQIVFPDYSGNGLFMTLGNLVSNPNAGLLIINFTTGSALQITGTATVIFAEERSVKISIKSIVEHACYSPFLFEFIDYSPYCPALTTNDEVMEGDELQCVQVIDETHNVKTFVFQTKFPITYQAGMYASFNIKIDKQKLVRTWTISSSTSPNTFSITVKKNENGTASTFLHQYVRAGTDLQNCVRLNAIGGDFTLNVVQNPSSKMLMIAGGIGITPLFAMMQTAQPELLTLVYCVPTEKDIVFAEKLLQLGKSKTHILLSRQDTTTVSQTSTVHHEKFSLEWMKRHFPHINEFEVFLCGPEGFMKTVQSALTAMQFNMDKCHLERFNF